MDIVTQELAIPLPQREPTDAEIQAARERLAQLDAEARSLGETPRAAPVHYAMGRIWVEQLGDQRSAAICFQNAFHLNPKYAPNLEAARRLFASAGRHEQSAALHAHEQQHLEDPAQRAESLRAQARGLRQAGRNAEAKRLVDEALELSPDHPALLAAAIDAASEAGERTRCAKLLLRAAEATPDEVHRAQALRRAVLLLETLLSEGPESATPPPVGDDSATPAELAELHAEASRKLHEADPHDPVGHLATLLNARARNDWAAVLELCRARAARTGEPSDRAVVASILAFRLGRFADALAEVNEALQAAPEDAGLLTLQLELAERHDAGTLPGLLRRRADLATEPGERAHLRVQAAAVSEDPREAEQLLSRALADEPNDAVALALHARQVAARDPVAAAERCEGLAERAEGSADEAARLHLEAAAWWERARKPEAAAACARKVLALLPRHAGALRLLTRTLPALGSHGELAELLETAAPQLPRPAAAELLARAAALLVGQPGENERALRLAQRAADLARGLTTPRGLDTWSMVAFRAGDPGQLAQALEARADSTHAADAAELLVEASELARAAGDEPRSIALLHKARGIDPASGAIRTALLSLPSLPAIERVELLAEEARVCSPGRAAALHAERAQVLEGLGRLDEAVQASAQALALGGAEPAVLRRLARLQTRRGDHAAAVAVLAQVAETVADGAPRAEAYARAAEVAEWRLGDARRAIELWQAAARANPQATPPLAQSGRLLAWAGEHATAAQAFERLSRVSLSLAVRGEARRWAASLFAHRAGDVDKAATLLRALLSETPDDLEATSELLGLLGQDHFSAARRERAELRGRLADRCEDARVAALLRAESAEDRLAAGDRDQGIAEYRRALALNPHDRVALDVVEGALRASGQTEVLAEHLAFRCGVTEGETRAALALQQAELLTASGDLEAADVALQKALAADPDSVLVAQGIRRLEELKAAARPGGPAPHLEPGAPAEATLRANDAGEPAQPDAAEALELEAEEAEADGDLTRAAELLERRLALASDEGTAASVRLRLGRLHARRGDAAKALPLLAAVLGELPPVVLLRLVPAADGLSPAQAAVLYGRLLEAYPDPADAHLTQAETAAWTEGLACALTALGRNDEAIAAHRKVFELSPQPETLHALYSLFKATGRADATLCAAAALAGCGAATAEQKALYEAAMAKPLAAELPRIGTGPALRAPEDSGATRELLAGAADALSRIFPADLAGRAAVVKGDNPVRRTVAAIARALGVAEPQLFLAKSEPHVVAPVATEPPGLLIGAEVPKRFSPRQQRFLYARALAHLAHGTQALHEQPAERLEQLVVELARACAPDDATAARLPARNEALAELVTTQLPAEARKRLQLVAARTVGELPRDFEAFALGLRESAERVGLVLSGDPGAAVSVVTAECGGPSAPEVLRLARFAVSEEYLALRPK